RAVGPVEDVVLAVLAAVADCLAPAEWEEDGRLRAVVIPDVVVDALEVPLRLSRRQRDRDDRGGEEIVAWTVLAQDVRRGISCDEVDQSQVHIDGRRIPDCSAASLELVALRGAIARGVRGGEAPHHRPVRLPQSEDLAADLEL